MISFIFQDILELMELSTESFGGFNVFLRVLIIFFMWNFYFDATISFFLLGFLYYLFLFYKLAVFELIYRVLSRLLLFRLWFLLFDSSFDLMMFWKWHVSGSKCPSIVDTLNFCACLSIFIFLKRLIFCFRNFRSFKFRLRFLLYLPGYFLCATLTFLLGPNITELQLLLRYNLTLVINLIGLSSSMSIVAMGWWFWTKLISTRHSYFISNTLTFFENHNLW